MSIGGFKLIGCGYVDDSKIFDKIERDAKYYKRYAFVPFIPEQQMNGFYSRMNLFVCVSRPNIEAGPLPVLEAMACGIPVISTHVGWARDHCENESNIWFITDDEANDFNKLGKIIKNVYERMDIRNHLRDNALHLIKNFSIEKYAERVMEVYEIS